MSDAVRNFLVYWCDWANGLVLKTTVCAVEDDGKDAGDGIFTVIDGEIIKILSCN